MKIFILILYYKKMKDRGYNYFSLNGPNIVMNNQDIVKKNIVKKILITL